MSPEGANTVSEGAEAKPPGDLDTRGRMGRPERENGVVSPSERQAQEGAA